MLNALWFGLLALIFGWCLCYDFTHPVEKPVPFKVCPSDADCDYQDGIPK